MADIPRDPRQLARDILAGKISIEDLAREQQRRRAASGGGGQAMPQAKVPDRVPLPRSAVPVPQPPRNTPRPVVRPVSLRPKQQQRPFPLRPAPPPVRRPAGPNIERRPAPQLTQPPPARPVPAAVELPSQENAYGAPSAIPGVHAAPANPRFNIGSITRNRAALRQSVLMAEILGKPLSLRQEW
jgi:hypothetical protein